jgi:polyphosphate kinase
MVPLDDKEKFISRDLSWLMFNERVLEEAIDAHNPLLERLKFMAIFVNNFDEFWMVRVAGLKSLIASGFNRKDSYGYYPHELLDEVRTQSENLTKRLYDLYQNKIFKELEKNQISLKSFEELSAEQKKFARRYFETTIFPIVTPLAVDQGRPFPILPSKTMAFAVSLSKKEESLLAVLPLPKNIKRLLKLPAEKDETSFILIDELIKEHLNLFFKGFKINHFALFRVIKDSEFTVEEEYTSDLLKAIESEVKRRSWAPVVHLEIEKDCEASLLEVLCQGLNFPKEEVVYIPSALDLTFLFDLVAQAEKPQLCYKSFVASKPDYENIFDKINEGDFVVHLPFQSFVPTLDLIQTAARDENVLAIKMTLYRTNEYSGIIKALKEAAENKKQVTVLVEIKARFDEEKNIQWVRELEAAGCHVIYGLAGIKVHSKMALIVRREEGRIRRYVHLSTGNYNENTAKIYTDVGYFTSNEDFAKDISDMFNVITGYSLPTSWKRIISAPYDLRKYFFDLIDREIQSQRKEKNGFIWAKMNSLEDPEIIQKLYAASQEGVKIRLLVRGICCLIPGKPGLSENIEVHSIVGRFLEHSRIYIFNNNGSPRIFVSSADWMRRNFDRRIELMFEIYKEEIKEHLQSVIKMYWKDNVKARQLTSEKTYVRHKNDEEKFSIQERLIDYYARS